MKKSLASGKQNLPWHQDPIFLDGHRKVEDLVTALRDRWADSDEPWGGNPCTWGDVFRNGSVDTPAGCPQSATGSRTTLEAFRAADPPDYVEQQLIRAVLDEPIGRAADFWDSKVSPCLHRADGHGQGTTLPDPWDLLQKTGTVLKHLQLPRTGIGTHDLNTITKQPATVSPSSTCSSMCIGQLPASRAGAPALSPHIKQEATATAACREPLISVIQDHHPLQQLSQAVSVLNSDDYLQHSCTVLALSAVDVSTVLDPRTHAQCTLDGFALYAVDKTASQHSVQALQGHTDSVIEHCQPH